MAVDIALPLVSVSFNKARADAELALLKDTETRGSAMSTAMLPIEDATTALNPGEQIPISVPILQVHDYYSIAKITHKLDKSGNFTTEVEVRSQTIKIPNLFKERIVAEKGLEDIYNPNELENTYNFTFEDFSKITTHTNLSIADDELYLSNETGTLITDIRDTSSNVTKCEVRMTGQDMGDSTFYISVDGGVSWEEVILKPVYGYSGRGICVGCERESRDEDIQTALDGEPYIVQTFIPKGLWAEAYPWLDAQGEEIVLKPWQTDFRCFIDDRGLVGFLARFGGIPTNVGAGGGGQSVAILKTEIPVREAVDRINEAIMGLGYSTVMEIQGEVDRMGLELGHTYLKGPTPTTLRPRVITQDHLASLQKYSANLWSDSLILERMWREGKLDHVAQMGEEEAKIARMQPWVGSPALIASDCLFSFGAHVRET